MIKSNQFDIYSPNEIKEMDKATLHDTPLGQAAFVVLPMKKAFVHSYYKIVNGKMVHVDSYHNKVTKKPEELTEQYYKENGLTPASTGHLGIHPKVMKPGQPLSSVNEHYTSYQYGDQVFVRYSHMHDQQFLVGVVVGIRDDVSHAGLLINVQLQNGKVESYKPKSLMHIRKGDAENRQDEKEDHNTDEKGQPVHYKHLNDVQLGQFYDLQHLWFKLQRTSEIFAFQNNKDQFVNADGTYPKNKSDMTKEQKALLESLNPIAVVPFKLLVEQVSASGYSDGTHYKAMQNLLNDLKTLKEQGAPDVPFPKYHKKKSKKEPFIMPEAWYKNSFPLQTTDEKIDEDELDSLMAEIKKETGSTPSVPKPQKNVWGADLNYTEVANVHGSVIHDTTDQIFKYPQPAVPAPAAQMVPPPPKDKPAAPKKTGPSFTIPEDKINPEAKKTPTPAPESIDEDDIANLFSDPKKFKVMGTADNFGFGGIHTKYILDPGDGHQYLFKPYLAEEPQRAWADIIACKVAQATGLPTAEFGSKPITVKIPSGSGGHYAGSNAVGSVQRVMPNVKHKDIGHLIKKGWASVPKEIIERFQQEHVVDWLLGNNDAHQEQFVVLNDGKIIGVDKGQAFKFYKQDKLDLTYDPNVNHKKLAQIYNLMLEAAKAGDIKLDWAPVQNFIEHNMKNLTPLAWTKMLFPYAAHSAAWGNKQHDFVNLGVQRKEDLLKDFKKLYASAGIATEYDAKHGSYSQAEQEELPASETHQPDAFQNIDATFHAHVVDAKASGKAIMLGGGDIEDMNMLFTTYDWKDGNKGLTASGKVLAGSEAKILGWFDTVVDQQVEYIHQLGPLPKDTAGDIVISAAKTVNNHCKNGGKNPDGNPNETKMNEFAKMFQGLDKFDPNEPLLDIGDLAMKFQSTNINKDNFNNPIALSLDVANHYHQIATHVMQAVKTGGKTASKMYGKWAGKDGYDVKSTSVSKTNKPWASFPKFEYDPATGGLIRTKGEKKATYKEQANYGTMFSKSLPGNIEVRYYPHYSTQLHGQNNYRSQQGSLMIDMHKWDGNLESMHQLRHTLKDMGLDHRLSNHDDIECLYLTRSIFHNKGDVSNAKKWKKVTAMENGPDKIKALKELATEVYGKSPDELKNYNPMPQWDDNTGYHYFLNPWVLDHLQESDTVPITSHGITGSNDSDIDAVTNMVNLGMLSTEARHQMGFKVDGMSSTTDQSSGGAAYVFNNLQNGSKCVPKGQELENDSSKGSNGFIFRPELLARTDTLAYSNDNYGATFEAGSGYSGYTKTENRIGAMDYVKNGSHVHELNFKNRISLYKWLLGPKGTSTFKKKLKAVIKKHKPHMLNHTTFLGV